MNNFGFPTEFIEEVKARSNIISVMSGSISLQKKGRYFWACCPFHHEKTPSFAVSEDEQIFHCYGCGEGGDVISFVQKYENLSFMDAVKLLAKDAGLSLPTNFNNDEELKKLRLKEKVMHALEDATTFYQNNLKGEQGGVAREYATSRHFSSDILQHFRIGFSKDFGSLITYLKGKNVSEETMKEAGLIETSSSGKIYDVFAGRMIFPIINSFGDVIGFTARVLQKDSQYAKYRNSTQTIVFDKSKTVYNINTIRELKKQGELSQIFILEGTVDVIAAYRAGIKNAVACLGTAITKYHATALSRFVDKVVLCLDGDSAGQKATYKAIDVLREAGLEVRVVRLKENLDPDEFLNKYGADELKEALSSTIDAIEYELQTIRGKYDIKDSYGKSKFISESLDVIKRLETSVQMDIYLKVLSNLSSVSVDILRRDLNRLTGEEQKSLSAEEEKTAFSSPDSLEKAKKFILSSLCFKKPYAQKALDENLSFTNGTYQRLFDFLKNCHKSGKVCTVSSLYDYFDIDSEPLLKEIINTNFQAIDNEEDYFNQCLLTLKNGDLKDKQAKLLNSFKTETDAEKRRQIAKELGEIAKELKRGENRDV